MWEVSSSEEETDTATMELLSGSMAAPSSSSMQSSREGKGRMGEGAQEGFGSTGGGGGDRWDQGDDSPPPRSSKADETSKSDVVTPSPQVLPTTLKTLASSPRPRRSLSSNASSFFWRSSFFCLLNSCFFPFFSFRQSLVVTNLHPTMYFPFQALQA